MAELYNFQLLSVLVEDFSEMTHSKFEHFLAQSASGFKFVFFNMLQPRIKCAVLEPDFSERAFTHIRSN